MDMIIMDKSAGWTTQRVRKRMGPLGRGWTISMRGSGDGRGTTKCRWEAEEAGRQRWRGAGETGNRMEGGHSGCGQAKCIRVQCCAFSWRCRCSLWVTLTLAPLPPPPLVARAPQVATIDSFQGAEKEIIILATTITRAAHFAADPQRLNVALTR